MSALPRSSSVTAWLLLLLASAGGPVLAQQVRATVDRNELTLDEQLMLTVTVEGAVNVVPELPPLPDFRVLPRGQSTITQIVNGRSTIAAELTYLLIPLRVGKFEIGTVSAEIDGSTYTSRPFTVRVLEASAEPTSSRDAFVTARVSKADPFVGEQVLFTWRFYRRVPVANASLTALEFGDLVAEDLGDVREYDTTVEGVQYRVSELRKALFAQRVGKSTVPPSELSVQVATDAGRRRRSVFDFGRVPMETRLLRSRPIELDVKPLPKAPPGFSGLVGRFDLSVEISKRSLEVNESATLTMRVSGTGNVQLLHAPELPELPAFKVYEDKPAGRIDRSGLDLSGSKTYRTALVPLAPGEHRIPGLSLITFDPESEQFRTAKSQPIVLDVQPGQGGEELRLTESVAPSSGKVAVRILADDILPIHRGLEAVSSGPLAGLRGGLWLALGLAPPLAFGALLARERRRFRSERDRALDRRRQALRRATRAIDGLTAAPSEVESIARRASLALRCYVGDKLGAEGSALTAIEAESLLRDAGVDEATTRRVRELLERLEAAQYGAASARLDSASLARSLGGLIRDLDRMLGNMVGNTVGNMVGKS
ncbi:MAG TPA: BatD family protein [Thermoanaerobaculia bacterium]|nr:BatD family protein [Thermoanaerobaculia bacterium]